MRTRSWSSSQRMLLPLISVFWRVRDSRPKDKVCKSELLDFRTVDLELEAQYKEVRKQLEEYDRSKEPESRGRWTIVCPACTYINHERHTYCESCGSDLVEEVTVRRVYVCPRCESQVPRSAHKCPECGSRFWSPIILSSTDERVCRVEIDEGPEDHRP